LSSIFSTLRNTEQYWRKPRSDLNYMAQHYKPATWFLILRLWDELDEYNREVNGLIPFYLLVFLLEILYRDFSTNKF